MSTRLLNTISSGICRQNTQLNMYTSTSKRQEGCTFKDSHPKCFITTNFNEFHREAVVRGGESTRFAHSKWVIEVVLKFRMRVLALPGYYLHCLKDDIVGYCMNLREMLW